MDNIKKAVNDYKFIGYFCNKVDKAYSAGGRFQKIEKIRRKSLPNIKNLEATLNEKSIKKASHNEVKATSLIATLQGNSIDEVVYKTPLFENLIRLIRRLLIKLKLLSQKNDTELKKEIVDFVKKMLEEGQKYQNEDKKKFFELFNSKIKKNTLEEFKKLKEIIEEIEEKNDFSKIFLKNIDTRIRSWEKWETEAYGTEKIHLQEFHNLKEKHIPKKLIIDSKKIIETASTVKVPFTLEKLKNNEIDNKYVKIEKKYYYISNATRVDFGRSPLNFEISINNEKKYGKKKKDTESLLKKLVEMKVSDKNINKIINLFCNQSIGGNIMEHLHKYIKDSIKNTSNIFYLRNEDLKSSKLLNKIMHKTNIQIKNDKVNVNFTYRLGITFFGKHKEEVIPTMSTYRENPYFNTLYEISFETNLDEKTPLQLNLKEVEEIL